MLFPHAFSRVLSPAAALAPLRTQKTAPATDRDGHRFAPTSPLSPSTFFSPRSATTSGSNSNTVNGGSVRLAGAKGGATFTADVPTFVSPILGIKRCSTLGLFASFSADTVCIWSLRPHVLLSCIERSEASIQEEGAFVDMLWSNSGHSVVLSTDKGFVHFYDVVYIDEFNKPLPFPDRDFLVKSNSDLKNGILSDCPLFDARYTTAAESILENGKHDYSRFTRAYALKFQNDDTQIVEDGPGEKGGALRLCLYFRLTLRISQGIRSMLATDTDILISTRENQSVLSLSWKGEVIDIGTFSLKGFDFYLDNNCAVHQITQCSDSDLFAWISESGRAYLARRLLANDISERQAFIEKINKLQEDVTAKLAQHSNVNSLTRQTSNKTFSIKHDLNPPKPLGWSGTCFYNIEMDESRATCVAFNKKFNLLALGTETGEVYVYSLSEDGGELNFQHMCFPDNTTNSPDKNVVLGPVQCLQWTVDGKSLAVGWSEYGLSIWSTYGRLIAISKSEEMIDSNTTSFDFKLLDDYTRGVSDLFWSDNGFELFVLPVARGFGATETHGSEVHVISFLKSSISMNTNIDSNRKVFLLSDESIMIYKGNSQHLDILNLEVSPWDTVQLPPMYTSFNWPIKYASADSTGKFIALAGRRGFTYYNAYTGRWKLFGNEVHEAMFSIQGGIHWVSNLLMVCACRDYEPEPGYYIRGFASNLNLDLDNLVFSIKMSQPVLSISGYDTNIMTYSSDNVIRHYCLYKEKRGRFNVEYVNSLLLVQEISLDGVVFRPLSVQSIGWTSIELTKQIYGLLQKHTIQKRKDMARTGHLNLSVDELFNDSISPDGVSLRRALQKAPIVLLNSGELSILRGNRQAPDSTNKENTFNVGWEMISLADKIEHCSVFRPSDMVPELHHSLWAFGSKGVILWTSLESGSSSAKKTVTKSPQKNASESEVLGKRQNSFKSIETDTGFSEEWVSPLRINLDFGVLSVLGPRGIIAGVEIVASPSIALKALRFKMVDKTTLFIPHVIRYFLSLEEPQENETIEEEKEGHPPSSPGSRLPVIHTVRKSSGYRRALRFAKAYSKLPYFNHALEILLHKALDNDLDEIARDRKKRMQNRGKGPMQMSISQRLLPRTAAFAKEFPDYLDVVVQCARKIDVSSWPYLFSTVGNPLRLFGKCIQEGRLRSAISYLIVLQSLESTFVSGCCTAILLERASELQHFETLRSLVRFVSGIQDRDGSIYACVLSDYTKISHKDSDDAEGSKSTLEVESAVFSKRNSINSITSETEISFKYTPGAIGTMEEFFDRHPELVESSKSNNRRPSISVSSDAALSPTRKNGTEVTQDESVQDENEPQDIYTIRDALHGFCDFWHGKMEKNKETDAKLNAFLRAMQC